MVRHPLKLALFGLLQDFCYSQYSDIDIDSCIDMGTDADIGTDSKQMEDGCRMIYAGVPSFFLGFWGWRTVMFQFSGVYCMAFSALRRMDLGLLGLFLGAPYGYMSYRQYLWTLEPY